MCMLWLRAVSSNSLFLTQSKTHALYLFLNIIYACFCFSVNFIFYTIHLLHHTFVGTHLGLWDWQKLLALHEFSHVQFCVHLKPTLKDLLTSVPSTFILLNKFSIVYINVMWSEKIHHMVQNWYLELLVSCENLNYSLFRTFYLDLFWYWYQKLLMFKDYKNKENIYVNFLSFVVSPFATCDRFSKITSQMDRKLRKGNVL